MKPKKCKNKQCGKIIHDPKPFQKACSPSCAIELVREKQRKEHRKETRRMREAAKTKSELLKEAQYEFNRFIRIRDQSEPCISCGRPHEGQYHAGHFRTVGAYPELRFHEDNCHKQCAPCNNHKSGNLVEYRQRLVQKIGLERVKWLEGPHDLPNWTHDEIREIKKKYKQKCKELENAKI